MDTFLSVEMDWAQFKNSNFTNFKNRTNSRILKRADEFYYFILC